MPMKLILRADVENLGQLGDVVDVKPGYGRNYLIPQGLAMPATNANLRVFEQERRKLQARMDTIRGQARTLGDKISRANLLISMRVGEGDKLYGSVTRAMLAEKLQEVLGDDAKDFDRKKILLEEPIRALGEYQVAVKLHAGIQASFTVNVVRHGAETADAPPEEQAAAPQDAAVEQ